MKIVFHMRMLRRQSNACTLHMHIVQPVTVTMHCAIKIK